MNLKRTENKIECINPNTRRSFFLNADTWMLFNKAIAYALKENSPLTYSEIVEGVEKYFKTNAIQFKGSLPWYAVSVKLDMEAKGMIEAFTEKGKKLHRLSATSKKIQY